MPSFLLLWYNKHMLVDYYNSAILKLKEYRSGVAKLERLPNETLDDFSKRRKAYLEKSKRNKRK